MDKRSLLFVISLTMTFFVTNMIFTYLDQQKNHEWYEQQKKKKTEQQLRLKEEINTRTAHLADVPLVTIYGDKDHGNTLGRGLVSENYLFSLFPQKPATKIFVQGSQDPWNLLQTDEKTGLTIYANKAKLLKTTPLPPHGMYDLQLLSLQETPEVLWAEYKDGEVSIPLTKLSENKLPQGHALALIKQNGIYQPIGVYDFSSHALIRLENISSLASILDVKIPQSAVSKTPTEEKLYVIETPYQQLVFSNRGGSLVEINLPFQNEEFPQSIVKEISVDREIAKQYPNIDRFPNQTYYLPPQEKGGEPVLQQEKVGGYYPLIRRSLPGQAQVNPGYYATNLVSEYPEVSEMFYAVKSFDHNQIVFEATQPHRKITKTYTIAEANGPVPYTFDLEIKIEGDSRGLWLSSGLPEVEIVSGSSAPSLMYRITRNQQSEVETINLPKENLIVTSLSPDWVSNANGFFGIIIDPLTEIDSGYQAVRVPGTKAPSRMIYIGKDYEQYKAADFPGYATMLPLPSKGAVSHFRIYAGPYAESALKKVDAIYSNDKEGYQPDYLSAISYHGWFAFISRPFAKFLLILMNFFYSISGSWALSIILLTVALRIMLYPLNSWSMKSMAKMQLLAPEVEKIKKKHQKDPRKMQLEMASLYREKGINPLSGCFPLLIQMPFLIGMFDLLKSSFELRGAVFIPGWIDNLAAPDVLFSWEQPILFFGNAFHLLPFLLGFVMYFQQKLFSPPVTQTMTPEQRQQRIMMSYMMPILFTFMFYNVPSGLNIYWLFSMLLGLPQQWWTTRMMRVKKTEEKKLA